tara:strand:+ start:18151 stop:18690 length:540 start_codon:yes stop_codon:yes gene_type:complete
MTLPAFFFDRDGVVNRDPHPEPYVLSWEQWDWNPGIVELLVAAKSAGLVPVLVTSQKGVGKGLMTEADLEEIHGNMQTFLRENGVEFAEIYAFTGLPNCLNQPKPDPQMLERAALELNLDLGRSWLIGDADRDIEMGRRAGVGHLIRVEGIKSVGIEAEYQVSTLDAALEIFENRQNGN